MLVAVQVMLLLVLLVGAGLFIRMALGALQSQVIWMVMREVLLLAGIGVVAGLAAFALASVACAAGYIPALRASRVEAVQALRYE